MTRLNQILAVEAAIKSRSHDIKTTLHKATQKAELMNGFRKKYTKKDEEGVDFPDEVHLVQFEAEQVFDLLRQGLKPLLDVTAEKDFANCKAKADVKVGDQVIVEGAPPTYLLFLRNQLTDLRTFVQKMVVLNPGVDWVKETESGLYRTQPETTERTRKDQVPVVLHAPTKEHPAQTQLVTKDVIVGHWETVKLSGAIPLTRKRQLLSKIDTLLKAVVYALEEANQQEVEGINPSESVLGYIFGE